MKEKIIQETYRLFISSFGIILLGMSLNYLSWKYQMVSSGLPGYALGLNFLTGFPVGTFLLISNTIILILSFTLAGKTAGLRGVYGYVLLSLFIDGSRKYFRIQQALLPSLATNAGLIVLQGIIAPIAIALVMANGYSFGSYSSMMPIVKRFSTVSAPKFFMIMDLILVILTLFLFGIQRAVLLFLNAVVFFVVFRWALLFIEKHLSLQNIHAAA